MSFAERKLILSKENVDEKFVDELNLSNGEKQNILLYLTLFKKPKIVFLDESTSYLST
ncbi:ATP-binding cassette domain-containing protein, partial [Salmonella enterica]|uniref:ATP-binding cassette domain-containing protein n=1 Tax=Salmonella enterica TaxID=28901 RepID=UPI0035B5A4D3